METNQANRQAGQTSKYLAYAIGEILLVVIGILIALELNKWNESKKAEVFELKILSEIRTDLITNIGQFERAMLVNDAAIVSCNVLLNRFETDLPYHDSLASHFSKSIEWFYPSVNSPAFESLKSYGTHNITNDSIRNNVSFLYGNRWIDILSQRQETYFSNTVAPILTKLFDKYAYRGEMTPLNYNQLKKDKQYSHILRTMIENRKIQLEFFDEFANFRRKAVESIDEELISRGK